jgi:hypothetical protein
MRGLPIYCDCRMQVVCHWKDTWNRSSSVLSSLLAIQQRRLRLLASAKLLLWAWLCQQHNPQ